VRIATRISAFITLLALVAGILLFGTPSTWAASTMAVHAPASATVGDNVTITVNVNTNGDSANAFEADFSYPDALFDPVRGTYSGGSCNLPITQPDPSGGSASISCGATGGASGNLLIATIVLKAKGSGSAHFGLSGCSVLANDGQGTDITGGCSGDTMTINDPAPAATAAPTPVPTAKGATPKPTATPTAKATPTPVPKPAEVPTQAPATAAPTPPPVVTLPSSTPTPKVVAAGSSPGPSATPEVEGKRTISQAIGDLFSSLKGIGSLKNEATGLIALLLILFPFTAILLAILFFIYRLYAMGKQRRRTMDRLFEMELSELAALEAKMDLLSEKGTKGRDQYREEFRISKEKILRELKPDYGKPIEGLEKPAAATPAAPAA